MAARIGDILKHWKRIRMVTGDALDLLNKMMRYEDTRISLEEVLKHTFFGEKQLEEDTMTEQLSRMSMDENTKKEEEEKVSDHTMKCHDVQKPCGIGRGRSDAVATSTDIM